MLLLHSAQSSREATVVAELPPSAAVATALIENHTDSNQQQQRQRGGGRRQLRQSFRKKSPRSVLGLKAVWQQRFFVLDEEGKALRYYRREGGRQLGAIGFQVRRAFQYKPFTFTTSL